MNIPDSPKCHHDFIVQLFLRHCCRPVNSAPERLCIEASSASFLDWRAGKRRRSFPITCATGHLPWPLLRRSIVSTKLVQRVVVYFESLTCTMSYVRPGSFPCEFWAASSRYSISETLPVLARWPELQAVEGLENIPRIPSRWRGFLVGLCFESVDSESLSFTTTTSSF
jgi:hypothetical protein